MQQDFSRKMVLVIREDMESWKLTNTVAHIAAFLGNKMDQPFDTGNRFISRDGFELPRNSQYPIVTLKAPEKDLLMLARKLRASGLTWIAYTQDMVDLTNDQDLEQRINSKEFEKLSVLGIGAFGTKQDLKQFTNDFPLWK